MDAANSCVSAASAKAEGPTCAPGLSASSDAVMQSSTAAIQPHMKCCSMIRAYRLEHAHVRRMLQTGCHADTAAKLKDVLSDIHLCESEHIVLL